MNVTGAPDPQLAALNDKLRANSLGGHWQPRRRRPDLVPYVWKWPTIRSCLTDAGRLVHLGEEGAVRRTVNLVNPSIVDDKTTSRTIQMSVQLVNPGETADCHRHTAAALRFVVEGDGSGYTTVEGEQMFMRTGDLVLTPSWTWHDHTNAGDRPLVWLDVLDLQFLGWLGANLQEDYPTSDEMNAANARRQPITRNDGDCRLRFGWVRPRDSGETTENPPLTYRWADTLAVMEEIAAHQKAGKPGRIIVDYANPTTGGSTLPTIHCSAQMLRPGEKTDTYWENCNTIYHVVQGSGLVRVGKSQTALSEMKWEARDCFFIPQNDWHVFENSSATEPLYLFAVSDRPILEKFGLYRQAYPLG